MSSNLIHCWLENVLDIEVDPDRFLKDHVMIANFIIALVKKYHLIDKDIQRSIQNASCLEQKLAILRPHLIGFGKIDEKTLTCVKCGSIENLRKILTQMYLTFASAHCYKWKKLKTAEALNTVEEKYIEERTKLTCKRTKRRKCKKRSNNHDPTILLKQRQELEEHYRAMRSKYNVIQKAEFLGLRKLFHSILNIGIQLSTICEQYKYVGTKIPDNILSEWTSLLSNRHEIYDLPLYLTPEDMLYAKVIDIDETRQKVISNLNKQQYLCSQGPWMNLNKPNNAAAEVDKVLSYLKRLSYESKMDISSFPIRATIRTNMTETEKVNFMKGLKKELEPLKVEIIDPQCLFEKALAEVLIVDVVSDICVAEEVDDGICELVRLSSDMNNQVQKKDDNKQLKRKSSLKRTSSENGKPRKSVTISSHADIDGDDFDEVYQSQNETHICQTPTGWCSTACSNVSSFLHMKSSTFRENQLFNQLPLNDRVEFLVRHLQDLRLKGLNGFVLIDFPITIEDIVTFETILTGQTPKLVKYSFYQSGHQNDRFSNKERPKSFLTHYIRLKCYSELHNGLYCDEINVKEFQAVKEFFLNVGAYHTLEYYDVEQDISEISEMLKAVEQMRSKTRNEYAPKRCIRTQISPAKADVELQTDPIDFDPDPYLENQSTSNIDHYVEKSDTLHIVSKFFVEEQVQKWNSIQLKHESTITKPLLTRSNVLRENFCLQKYIEATFNFNIKETIDDSSILESFEEKFNELDIFYRKDEDGKHFLYSLIDDLSSQLEATIKEKERRNLLLLNSVWNDSIIPNMSATIGSCSEWLLYHEAQRLTDAINYITELFSILLSQEITTNIPDMNRPEDVALDLKKLSKIEVNSRSSLSQISDHNRSSSNKSLVYNQNTSTSQQVSAIDHGSIWMSRYLDLQQHIRLRIEKYCSMLQEVSPQMHDKDESIPSGSSSSINKPKPASLKTKRRNPSDSTSVISIKANKRSRKRKSNLHTIPSLDSRSLSSTDSKKSRKSLKKKISTTSVTSSSTYILTDSNEERSKTVEFKDQLKNCIYEQCKITKKAVDKIEKALQRDLKLLLLDNAEFLRKIEHQIKECQKVEVGQVRSLVKKLSEAIENTWSSVEICKCNGNYFVKGIPFISPTPSLESLFPDKNLLNQLFDIKFLITEFQTANSHSYHISYHKMMKILHTTLIKLYLKGSQLCNSMELIQTVLSQLKQVSDNSFIMDWRDLILNLIDIRSPTFEELLEMKDMFERKGTVKNFKWVSRGNYCQIKLWFECAYEREIACELKRIYFELYKKGEKSFWYETFLMRLCKLRNPLEGFRLALELCSGKRINDSHELGEEYLRALTNEAKFKSLVKQEIEDLTRNICCKILYSDELIPDHDPSLTHFIRSESIIIKTKSINCPSTKSILMMKALEDEPCIEQRCEVPSKPKKTPVERYLQIRKLHSCGCPTKEIDFESFSLFEKKEIEFCINKSLVLYVLEKSFPWYKEYKSDGYDIIEACNAIFDELFQELQENLPNTKDTKDISVPAHKLFEHEFIRHWIGIGLTFTSVSLFSLPSEIDKTKL